MLAGKEQSVVKVNVVEENVVKIKPMSRLIYLNSGKQRVYARCFFN